MIINTAGGTQEQSQGDIPTHACDEVTCCYLISWSSSWNPNSIESLSIAKKVFAVMCTYGVMHVHRYTSRITRKCIEEHSDMYTNGNISGPFIKADIATVGCYLSVAILVMCKEERRHSHGWIRYAFGCPPPSVTCVSQWIPRKSFHGSIEEHRKSFTFAVSLTER